MKKWLQPLAKKREKWLQPGSNDFNLYPFNWLFVKYGGYSYKEFLARAIFIARAILFA